METKIKLPRGLSLKGRFFGDIDAFNDIKFEQLETNDIRNNIQARIDFDGWFLYVIGSDKFMEYSFPSFDVSFIDTKAKERISPNAFLDFNDEGIKKLREGWGVELVRGDVLKNVSEESIMDIINSVKKNTSKTDVKQRASANIKEISDDLLKIAMMPKEYRVSSILNLKMLVDDLDEDDVPKEQVDLLKSIVDDLIDEVKYPTNQETKKEAESVQEEAKEQVDLESDICALNDLLDDAFDVDNVDDLLGLLDCEIGEEDMSYAEQKIYQKEKNLILDYKMDLGFSTYPFTINETIYQQNEIESRDIVDEETGFVIPIRLDATTKMLYPFDSEQLQRWEKWGLV